MSPVNPTIKINFSLKKKKSNIYLHLLLLIADVRSK